MKKIVLVGIPEYGNLGDIAITHAETEFIKDNFGESNPPKNMEDIKGVKVEVPALNIVPIPEIPIKDDKKKETK